MKVLVTGASGFLGGTLARALARRGDEVIASGRSAHLLAGAKEAGCRVVLTDLADAPAPAPLLALGRLDAIVHCAGLSSNWGPRSAFAANNIGATGNLLAAARQLGEPHVVYISSPSVYFAFRDQLGLHEGDPLPEPVNAYAWSKREAEALVRAAHDLPATIIRPRGIYGAGDTALLPRLVRAARRGPLPLLRGGRAVIDLTHVDDVVAAIVAILDRRAEAVGKTYNVSGGEPVRVVDIVERAAVRAGVPVRWRRAPWPVARAGLQALEAVHRVFRPSVEPVATVYSGGLLAFSQTLDISAIARDIGWRPSVAFSDGLERTFGSQGT